VVFVKFPEIRGMALNNIPFTIPNDLRSKLNILILPCEKSNKLNLERWISFMKTLISDIHFLDYYQINIYNKRLKVLRRYMSRRARRSILNRNIDKIINFYYDLNIFKNSLNLESYKNVYIFLINQEGDILWRTEGIYDLDKAQLLKQKIIEHMI